MTLLRLYRKNGFFPSLLFISVLVLGMSPLATWAEEEEHGEEESYFQNASQAQKAENLALVYYEENYKDLTEAELEQKLVQEGEVDAEAIRKMRADGMGWGVICHKLGIHPGALGSGHYKEFKNSGKFQYGNFVTARNFKTGWAHGHGNNGENGHDKEYKGRKGHNKDHGGGNGKGKK